MTQDDGLLLGKHTPVVEVYSPELLYPIPRATARGSLGLSDSLPFHGVDLWHAYEMSWLTHGSKPVARVGRFRVPCESPCIIESKSFKLYLNSLNNTQFADDAAAKEAIERDVSAAAGMPVNLELIPVDDSSLAGTTLPGMCLDHCDISPGVVEPSVDLLKVAGSNVVEERVFSHLLRSLCPVTGQPDWATLWIHYRGQPLDHGALLSYIISYRQHQEYHEQCVERMFIDLNARCQPEFLHIQAFYTRRGGMDINPFRSTDTGMVALPRMNRQ